YSDFGRRESGSTGEPGEIVDRAGKVLGRHAGLAGFTVGQRRGLGLASDRALYVVALEAAANRVVVGGEEDQYRSGLVAERANWVSIACPSGPIEAVARIRSSHAGAAALVEPLPAGRFRVRFREPQ